MTSPTPSPEENKALKGCEHHWKFNGGNPLCIECGAYKHEEARVVLSITISDGVDS